MCTGCPNIEQIVPNESATIIIDAMLGWKKNYLEKQVHYLQVYEIDIEKSETSLFPPPPGSSDHHSKLNSIDILLLISWMFIKNVSLCI